MVLINFILTLSLPFCFFDCLVSGPINREMRHLISTLQTHNQQMKGEVVKYKIRLREAQSELNQVGHEFILLYHLYHQQHCLCYFNTTPYTACPKKSNHLD